MIVPQRGTMQSSLPAWLYTEPAFFEAEKLLLFARTWHLVCHANDVPKAGDYHTLDILGEKFLVLRGADGVVRAFHNVCRHRASRLAAGYRRNNETLVDVTHF